VFKPSQPVQERIELIIFIDKYEMFVDFGCSFR